jgi:hypothetical protein
MAEYMRTLKQVILKNHSVAALAVHRNEVVPRITEFVRGCSWVADFDMDLSGAVIMTVFRITKADQLMICLKYLNQYVENAVRQS